MYTKDSRLRPGTFDFFEEYHGLVGVGEFLIFNCHNSRKSAWWDRRNPNKKGVNHLFSFRVATIEKPVILQVGIINSVGHKKIIDEIVTPSTPNVWHEYSYIVAKNPGNIKVVFAVRNKSTSGLFAMDEIFYSRVKDETRASKNISKQNTSER